MTQSGTEPRFSCPLANILTIMPMGRSVIIPLFIKKNITQEKPMRTIYLCELDEVFGLRFSESSLLQEATTENRRVENLKCYDYVNQR